MTTSAKAGGGSKAVFDQRKAKAKAKAESDQPDESAEDELPNEEVEDDEKKSKADEDGEGNDDEDIDAEDTDDSKSASVERGRIKAILTSDEAKGREASAQHLALNTDLSVDDAKKTLAGLEIGKPAAGDTPLQKAMANQPNANLGVDGGLTDPTAGNHGWDGIVADCNARFGRKA